MDFMSFARTCGLEIRVLYSGDKIYRCPTKNHPNSTNGAYFYDGRRGWVQNWEDGSDHQWWSDDLAPEWTPKEKEDWAKKRRAAEIAKQRAYEAAAKKATAMIRSASVGVHPYLEEKGFKEEKCLLLDGAMLVPMRSLAGEVCGVQTIALKDNQWDKKFLYGSRTKGAVYRIGPRESREMCLVEGYATGLSVDAALRFMRMNVSVMVCFSAQNIAHVAEKISGRKYIYADNDESGTGEQVAIASGVPYCMSDTVGNDANDDHIKHGLMEVVKKIMDVRRAL